MSRHGDTFSEIAGSTVQYGPRSNRVYLMHLHPGRTELLLEELDKLAREKGYTKIFAKIPADQWWLFQDSGYVREAEIPGLFRGEVDGLFVARYLQAGRRQANPEPKLRRLLRDPVAKQRSGERNATTFSPAPVQKCLPEEAPEMSAVYRQVFASYPFPITEPAYITETMEKNLRYSCIRRQGAIVALASAEVDRVGGNAELTDFATLPEWRGNGFAAALLRHMEEELAASGILTTYTIARAASYGMNLVFKRCGYSYGGFLPNNTNIAGRIQSMTVWYRHLCAALGP